MAIQITITPPEAAAAGCTASATQVATGSIPIDPDYPGENVEMSGTWWQYEFAATAAALWHAPLTCTVTLQVTETTIVEPGYVPQVMTRTYNLAVALGTRAPVDDDWGNSSNPYVEYDAVYRLLDANDGHLIAQTTYEARITNIAFAFARNLPHGPILCNQSGVMVCNQSGSLLWN